jgi:hypothetical protein
MSYKSLGALFLLACFGTSCNRGNDTGTGLTPPRDISWKKVGPDSIQVTALAVDPNGTIFASLVNNTDLLLRSTDEGETWVAVSVPELWPHEYIKAMAIDETGTIYAAVFNGMTSQLERSFDSGVSWIPTGDQGDIGTIACDNAGTVYVGTVYSDESGGSLRITTDRGTTWTLANVPTTVGVGSVAVSGLGTACALTGLGGVLRSTDRGLTWTKSDSGLPASSLWDLAASPNGMLYVSSGYPPQGIYRSSDDGVSWTSSGLSSYLANYLVVDTNNGIFALASYQSPKGLFRSTDNGTTWTEIQEGFTDDGWVFSFAVTPSGYLFVSTESEFLRSSQPATQTH